MEKKQQQDNIQVESLALNNAGASFTEAFLSLQ